MKKLLLLLSIFALTIGASFAQTATVKNDLASQLPASDAVVTMNLKRLINEALPQMLAVLPDELNKVNSQIDDFRGQTGIDLRQFEQAAVGFKLNKTANGKSYQGEPLLLLRGQFNSSALVGVGRTALKGKYRQETIAGKNVIIFTLPQSARVVQEEVTVEAGSNGQTTTKRTVRQAKSKDGVDKFLESLTTGELALTAVDGQTLAVGKVGQVRSLLSKTATTRGSNADLIALVNRNQDAVMSFASNVPNDLTAQLGLGNDQFGRIAGSLRQLFGAVDVSNDGALMSVAARTTNDASGQELEETLLGLQMLGKGILGGKEKPQDQVLARLVENLKITRTGNEVQLNATLPQADVNTLVGDKKKN